MMDAKELVNMIRREVWIERSLVHDTDERESEPERNDRERCRSS